MDPHSKKRRADENGAAAVDVPAPIDAAAAGLTRDDFLGLLAPFSRDQLAEIVASAAASGAGPVLDAVRAVADRDVASRKLFVRGLGWETTHDVLRSVFAVHGELEEAVVIHDKATGRSRGYGFVTFRHADAALLALKEPSKKIDGRMVVAQLAAAGAPGVGGAQPSADVSLRKIFVGNVPAEMPSERLLSHFSSYGEIEEGPLGFDKQTGKFRGFALFVYKTAEAAQASLAEPTKIIDGHQLVCKLAIEGKKGKQQGGPPGMTVPPVGGNDMGGPGGPGPGQYGSAGYGVSSYGGYTGNAAGGVAGANPGAGGHHPYGATHGLAGSGGQMPATASAGGAGLGIGAGPGDYGGGIGGSYGGLPSQYGGSAVGGYGSAGGMGGASLYRMPQGSAGPVQGGYSDGGNYMMPGPYRGQDPTQQGVSPGAGNRVPGMYPNAPSYY